MAESELVTPTPEISITPAAALEHYPLASEEPEDAAVSDLESPAPATSESALTTPQLPAAVSALEDHAPVTPLERLASVWRWVLLYPGYILGYIFVLVFTLMPLSAGRELLLYRSLLAILLLVLLPARASPGTPERLVPFVYLSNCVYMFLIWFLSWYSAQWSTPAGGSVVEFLVVLVRMAGGGIGATVFFTCIELRGVDPQDMALFGQVVFAYRRFFHRRVRPTLQLTSCVVFGKCALRVDDETKAETETGDAEGAPEAFVIWVAG
ncbi:hypothetical protein MSAN_01480600 [Mycena sanguinolenta]|uniref:Uncharacterized protein n=1 Tax=Mycena sanguinolenta TaxID=230812 RepID=A0A8H7D166_9AGAR|nr:hypothetical protein MSAN_01480600 [Mycena sanguinolenta]